MGGRRIAASAVEAVFCSFQPCARLKNADVITNTGMNQRQSGWNPGSLRSLIAASRRPRSRKSMKRGGCPYLALNNSVIFSVTGSNTARRGYPRPVSGMVFNWSSGNPAALIRSFSFFFWLFAK